MASNFAATLVLLFLAVHPIVSLDNGLARTPPMGWLSWARFMCQTDCDKYPDECINDNLYMDMANHLITDGYADLGYEYVNIDDCWSEMERDKVTGRLVANAARFPRGMKSLADYVHSLGLKFGLYNDMGTTTCGGYPGLWTGNVSTFDLDAETFAEWGVDSLKIDGCNLNGHTQDFDWMFPQFGEALNRTGRQILYSCEWPLYQYGEKISPNYSAIASTCNLIRNHDDVQDEWQSVLSILDFYAQNQDTFGKFQAPGVFFDPDMLVIGNFGLSLEQSKAQFALWAILGAPLYMSNDLRTISEDMKAILQNADVIRVNQDAMGTMGRRVASDNNLDVWVRALADGQFAVAYLNRAHLGSGVYVSHNLRDILPGSKAQRFTVRDLYTKSVSFLEADEPLELKVNPSGVAIVTLVPY